MSKAVPQSRAKHVLTVYYYLENTSFNLQVPYKLYLTLSSLISLSQEGTGQVKIIRQRDASQANEYEQSLNGIHPRLKSHCDQTISGSVLDDILLNVFPASPL